ncbi:MAG: carbohydrate kinase [Clostridia bacterium]|nr:carbohydrate kinase [Clostridia bacterium]
MKRWLLALDIGTSGAKMLLLDHETGQKHIANCSYPTVTLHAGWAEQNPALWWNGICETLPALLRNAGVDSKEIAAIGMDGISWTPVCLDVAGQVLCNVPIWYDMRAAEQCVCLKKEGLEEQFFANNGNPLEPYYTLPKVLWIREHLPETFAKIRHILTSNGYIVYKLTGAFTHDNCQAYGWGFYQLEKDAWDTSLMEELGIDPDILPALCACTQVVGTVTGKAAEETGLAEGIPVIAGGLDAACGALGAGVIEPGAVHEQSGSAGGMSICLEAFRPARGLIYSRHVVPGMHLLQGGTVGGGGLARWLAKVMYPAGACPENALEELTAAAETSPPGANGLIFLPYMAGERSPIWDPEAKGVFFGLDYSKTRGDMARAVLEGAAYALRHNLEAAGSALPEKSLLRAVGGAAKSPLWMQIKADITGHPICAVSEGEATGLGCAMLAGAGCGLYPDLNETVKRFVSTDTPFEPEPRNAEIYDQRYASYLELYRRLDGMKG